MPPSHREMQRSVSNLAPRGQLMCGWLTDVECSARMALKPPRELVDLLQRYDRGVQELALGLRELILNEVAPCHEYILEVYILALSYGSTDRPQKSFCYIGVLENYVNLGFHQGTSLRDSSQLLEGTGKQMRHIKIRNHSDLMNPAIRAYVQEAGERAGHETAGHKAKTVTIALKRKDSPKKNLGTVRL